MAGRPSGRRHEATRGDRRPRSQLLNIIGEVKCRRWESDVVIIVCLFFCFQILSYELYVFYGAMAHNAKRHPRSTLAAIRRTGLILDPCLEEPSSWEARWKMLRCTLEPMKPGPQTDKNRSWAENLHSPRRRPHRLCIAFCRERRFLFGVFRYLC